MVICPFNLRRCQGRTNDVCCNAMRYWKGHQRTLRFFCWSVNAASGKLFIVRRDIVVDDLRTYHHAVCTLSLSVSNICRFISISKRPMTSPFYTCWRRRREIQSNPIINQSDAIMAVYNSIELQHCNTFPSLLTRFREISTRKSGIFPDFNLFLSSGCFNFAVDMLKLHQVEETRDWQFHFDSS